MVSQETLDTIIAVRNYVIREGAFFDRLVTKDIYIHKDLSDEQLINFSGHALDLTIPDDLIENTIVVNDNGYVCWKHDKGYYVMPAAIIGITNNHDGKIGVFLDYKPTTLADFVPIGKG